MDLRQLITRLWLEEAFIGSVEEDTDCPLDEDRATLVSRSCVDATGFVAPHIGQSQDGTTTLVVDTLLVLCRLYGHRRGGSNVRRLMQSAMVTLLEVCERVLFSSQCSTFQCNIHDWSERCNGGALNGTVENLSRHFSSRLQCILSRCML